jgi:hypothetical protein
LEWILAGAVAGLLTLFDLDRIFYVPKKTSSKLSLWAMWYGFALANAALAIGVTSAVRNLRPFSDWYGPLRGAVVGLSVLAILRLKLTTFSFAGKEVPFGFELFYEGAKGFVYKRINSIAKRARLDETMELAKTLTLQELTMRARLNADQDALLNASERLLDKNWILQVLNDTNSSEAEKRAQLANYILSGQRP